MFFQPNSQKWKDYFLKQARKKHTVQRGGKLTIFDETGVPGSNADLPRTNRVRKIQNSLVKKRKTVCNSKKAIKRKLNVKRKGGTTQRKKSAKRKRSKNKKTKKSSGKTIF